VSIGRKRGVRITLRECAAMLLLLVAVGTYLCVAGGVAVYSLAAIFGPVGTAAAH
jgi:hypothetical protein